MTLEESNRQVDRINSDLQQSPQMQCLVTLQECLESIHIVYSAIVAFNEVVYVSTYDASMNARV